MERESFDVVVVGSGAGGMAAAITAAAQGLSTVLLEKDRHWGGTTARSGGGVWIPGNDVLLAEAPRSDSAKGSAEELAEARTYLHYLTGAGGCVDPARIDAFVERGPEALRFLTRHSELDLHWVPGYCDYFPEAPGGRAQGRSVEPAPFDARRLGVDFETLQPFYTKAPLNVVVQQADYRWLSTGLRHWRGPARMMRVGVRTLLARLRRRKLVGLGQALAAQLMMGVRRHGVDVRLGVGLAALTYDGDRVTGLTTTQDTTLVARRGVILACGGFDHDPALRAEHHRAPAGPALSLGATGNTGDGIRAAGELGADTALMEDAWWAPSIPLPKAPWFALSERSLPGSIMVNARGQRFMNESLPYVEATHAMYGGAHGMGDGPAENLPCWLIFDSRYRRRYLFAGVSPGAPLPKSWLAHGSIRHASTLEELGSGLGLPEGALAATVARFNQFAQTGLDADFGRGGSAYEHYYGDITNKPNPSLGALVSGPFYAAEMVPADLGTKGGLVTDPSARVLRVDGSVISGLYAAGNTSAAVMGHTYAGPGATIGPALVFGYLAALDCAAG